jgi:hypothetical protein
MIAELRPMGKLMMVVESLELTVTYAYEDLVFVEHNAFLCRFDDNIPQNIFLYFSTDLIADEHQPLLARLQQEAKKQGLYFTYSGKYMMRQKEETEEFEILFMNAAVN